MPNAALATESRPVLPDDAFSALFTAWHGDPSAIPEIEVRIQQLDGQWTDWQMLHQDHHVPLSGGDPVHFNPVFGRGIDFELRAGEAGILDLISASIVDASTAGAALLGGADEGGAPVELIDGFIIPRAAWGADESFRYEGQNVTNGVGWPPSYRPIEHVIVHHTVTEEGWDDPAAVVRAIYYYHAVVLDWNDIGYNFLIDVYGNVYEGRYGGPGVVGGHALRYNPGSIGIALIGTFTDNAPPQAAQDALVRLIRTRANHVDPTMAADWLDWAEVPNICGHGDLMSTECPGSDLHSLLPVVRGRLAGTTPIHLPPPIRFYDPTIVDFHASPDLVSPGGLIEIRATIAQEGRETLFSQGPEPGFVYDEGENYDSAGFAKVEERFRLTVDIEGEDGDFQNPYRWGFGTPVERGEAREIVGYIRASSAFGTRRLAPSIVREFVGYFDESAFNVTVHVVHPQVSQTPPSNDPDSFYFDATGHNVPGIFYAYWSAHGGLNRFGFPLTEAFDERSTTDGNTYLTQYFERARFEFHPELAAQNDTIKLGLLGREMTLTRRDEIAFRPITPFQSLPDQWYFPETQHSISNRFLETWIAGGGVATFGLPISEKLNEPSPTDGIIHLVQYFERARFEYHPNDTWEKQIKLGHLGREMLIDRNWLPGPEVVG